MPTTANQRLKERGDEPYHVNVHLRYGERILQHYCLFCKHGLFRSQYRTMTIDYGVGGYTHEILTQPVSIQCPKCGAIYHIQILSER